MMTCLWTVEGTWGQWSSWSACSVTCGRGTRTIRRQCYFPVNDSTLQDTCAKSCIGPDVKRKRCWSKGQWTSEWTNQSIKQSIDQSVNPSVNQSVRYVLPLCHKTVRTGLQASLSGTLPPNSALTGYPTGHALSPCICPRKSTLSLAVSDLRKICEKNESKASKA